MVKNGSREFRDVRQGLKKSDRGVTNLEEMVRQCSNKFAELLEEHKKIDGKMRGGTGESGGGYELVLLYRGSTKIGIEKRERVYVLKTTTRLGVFCGVEWLCA
jgi:hypothetical protein